MTYRPQVLAVAFGGTGLNATVANQILYSSGTNTIAGLTTANSGVLSTSSAGVPSIDTTNFAVLSTGLQLKGNNTNTAPPAGFIGERIESVIAANSSGNFSSTNPKNVTNIVLTAGIWDIVAGIEYSGASGTTTATFCSINTTSATLGVAANNSFQGSQAISSTNDGVAFVPSYRLTLSTNTTVYLVGQCTISAGTVAAGGRISATRVG